MNTDAATFYAVCNSRYFPGTVALLNSLRLTGHTEQLILGDCGLIEAQRTLLKSHCGLFEIPADIATDPVLFKAYPHLLKPTGTVAIIDSDMIITGSLEPHLQLARQGKICAFADPERDRSFGEWHQLFDLSKDLRHQTYVTTSYVVFSTVHWPDLLERWWRACEKIPSHRTVGSGAPNTDPLAQGDQDALNAVLMSEIPREALVLLPQEQRPIYRGKTVRVVDLRTLSCAYHRVPTLLLHADGAQKPWQHQSFLQVRNHAYLRLLRRLLLSPDVPLTVAPKDLPIWLRSGMMAQLVLRILHFFTVTLVDPLVRNLTIRRLGRKTVHRAMYVIVKMKKRVRAWRSQLPASNGKIPRPPRKSKPRRARSGPP